MGYNHFNEQVPDLVTGLTILDAHKAYIQYSGEFGIMVKTNTEPTDSQKQALTDAGWYYVSKEEAVDGDPYDYWAGP